MRLMTVRATAKALGVHENTVRHWERRGILQALRLPSSGFRRFPEESVRELVRQMQASVSKHPSDPGMPEDQSLAGTYDGSLAEQG